MLHLHQLWVHNIAAIPCAAILSVVVLVLRIGCIELGRCCDLCDNGACETRLYCIDHSFRCCFLLLAIVSNEAAILGAVIVPLPVSKEAKVRQQSDPTLRCQVRCIRSSYLFKVVGSCSLKNTSRISVQLISSVSYLTSTTSACPVVPLQTCL